MTDTALPSQPSRSLGLSDLANWARSGDIAMAMGVVTILVVLILPMPAFLLDVLLAISITFSVLILMTALFIHTPLEFSAFPTVLLIATMLRLALNLASTRLILSEGHEGPDAAGAVIEAFGNFVMQGNFVIGIIVFAILVIVNFVVITKGSGRIAEVAARFSLDAMPGKQMAIDADLSAGLINEDQARERRTKLEQESTFYGAMDGASKFVRGDAIAGLLITFINLLAGMIIGMAQNDMSFSEAAHTYTLLTIGDGLVSQIPALIVSTAAGLLVSKAGVDGAAEKALFKQLSGYPKALGMSAFLMAVMALLPGIPMIPFFAMAAGAGALAFYTDRSQKQLISDKANAAAAMKATEAKAAAAPAEPPISAALHMDEIRLELGYALVPMMTEKGGDGERLTDQIKALRRQLATELGFVTPSVRILDNMQLLPNQYIIKIKEVETGRGMVYPKQFMCMDPSGRRIDLPGTHTTEPTFGLPCAWIDNSLRDEAQLRGLTVVDAPSVLSTHLTEILKANMAELVSYGEVQKLLDELPTKQKKLVEDIVPSQITVTGIQRVLQSLLQERVSIRDLSTILEGMAEATAYTRNIQHIGEHVRARLGRQICAQHLSPRGYLPLVTLSPQWEHAFLEALVGSGDEQQLAMAPSKIQEFIRATRAACEQASGQGEMAVLLTSPGIRPYVRSIVERFRAQTPVLSQNEIHPSAKLKTVAQVS